MTYKIPAKQREAVAAATRRYRLFQAALDDGHPKALEAARQNNSMTPANDLLVKIEALPKEDRAPFKKEYLDLLAQGQKGVISKAAKARYKILRAEVVAEMEAAAAAPGRA